MRITAVIPVKDREQLLRQCLTALAASAAQYSDARIVVVDNGSLDKSREVATEFAPMVRLVESRASRVGGVRNAGAALDRDTLAYAFVDCDCIVPTDFFQAVADTFSSRGASAVGCEVVSPSDGHWTERAWDGLHRPGGDGPRHYINSACFCIQTEWFWRINGFDDTKVSSEDVDICRRLAAAGGTMWQSERLAIVHLGNPQSIGGLYRRIRWHGEGVWERGKGIQWSVTTIATLLHGVAVLSGTAAGVALIADGRWVGWLAIVLGWFVVPVLFVAARAFQHRRRVPVIGGIGLMSITFPARLHGLLRSLNAVS